MLRDWQVKLLAMEEYGRGGKEFDKEVAKTGKPDTSIPDEAEGQRLNLSTDGSE